MGEELAGANVGRSYSLAATSIAIFTFTLFFLYPRYLSGEANASLFQFSIVVMGVATFSFVPMVHTPPLRGFAFQICMWYRACGGTLPSTNFHRSGRKGNAAAHPRKESAY